ncbi:hypothetical protein [Haliangium sp.]|uniref:hypothetical protein n=1 Tax=Haliangium sp. TaxID=2663208 RepID=UPI003D10D85B
MSRSGRRRGGTVALALALALPALVSSAAWSSAEADAQLSTQIDANAGAGGSPGTESEPGNRGAAVIAPTRLGLAFARAHHVHGLPLPPRSRSQGSNRFGSGRGFRATVDFYTRFFKRQGLRHRAIPIYRYRGTVVARFLSEQPNSEWLALHVFQRAGKTSIVIVPR